MVVKIPPPMMLLTRRQLAVNQPIVACGLPIAWLEPDGGVMEAAVYASDGQDCELTTPSFSYTARIP